MLSSEEVTDELKRLAREFKKVYQTLSQIEIKEDIIKEKDNVLYDSKMGEIVIILKVPDTEKGVLVGVIRENETEKIGKFPTKKLHYDLACTNPYLKILKVYLDNLELLDVHLNKNLSSKVPKMMASVGLLKPMYVKVFNAELDKRGLNFLSDIGTKGLASKLLKKIIISQDNLPFLMSLAKYFIDQLSEYPLDGSKSPRSENDLVRLEKKEKDLLYKFYLDVAEKGIIFIFDSDNPKPYYLQIFLKSLEEIYLPYASTFDWKEEVATWFFSNIIIPFLNNFSYSSEVLSPRKQWHSPRTKDRKSSINSGLERWRNSFTGTFKTKGRKSYNNLAFDEMGIKKYLKDIGDLYLGLFYPNPINVDEDDFSLSTTSRYLKFVVNNFVINLFDPMTPRPPSDTDYFYEIEEIYEELASVVEDIESQDKPSMSFCNEIQKYLDGIFIGDGE